MGSAQCAAQSADSYFVMRANSELRKRSLWARFGVLIAMIGAFQVAGASAASAAPVTPFVSCVFNNTNGTAQVVFGYRSPNSSVVNVPLSFNNQASPGTPPTRFNPGTTSNAFVATIPNGDVAYWLLNSDGSTYYLAYAASTSTPKCAASPVPVTGTNPVGGVAGAGSMLGAVFVIRRKFGRKQRVKGTFAAPTPA